MKKFNTKSFWFLLGVILQMWMMMAYAGPMTGSIERQLLEITEKLLFNHDLNRPASPQDPLWRVISTADWNLKIGSLTKDEIRLLKEHMVQDEGLEADILMKEGFNYHTLGRLRWILGLDPFGVSYGVIDMASFQRTALGQGPSGIPEFIRLTNDQWETNRQGNLVLNYDPRTRWMIEKIQLLSAKAVEAADARSHSLRNLFVNRHRQVQTMLVWSDSVVQVLMQIQAVDAALTVRMAEMSPSHSAYTGVETIQIQLRSYRERFLDWLSVKLKVAEPHGARDSMPWASFGNMATESESELSKWQSETEQVILESIKKVDVVMGASSVENKYSGDLAPELELVRQQQVKDYDALSKDWIQVKERSYYQRTHTWDYIYLHSEQHGPYYETSRETRSRDIYGIDMAPIEEEQELVETLNLSATKLLKGKPQAHQILALRQKLLELQRQHQSYVEQGPKLQKKAPEGLTEGFSAQFEKRNQTINAMVTLLIDASYRHEVHEKLGYVGLDVAESSLVEYSSVLDRLERIATRFRITAYTLGTATLGGLGACLYELAKPLLNQ
jgi:hypothetical protein